MSTVRAAIVARARAEGRRAGRMHRMHGTVPVPPASITDGSLLMRQVASEWYRGLDEGLKAQKTA
jgi:hypothetical protein